MVLVAQDTTSLDFTSKPKIKGLGYLEHKYLYGIKVHSGLAITLQGQPLGLLSQIVWTRDIQEYGKKRDSARKPIEEKESYVWLKTLVNLQELGLHKFVLIGDRESDIFDLFNFPREVNQHLLIRSRVNRRVNTTKNTGKKLWDSLDSHSAYDIEVEIPRSRKQDSRIAKCILKFGQAVITQDASNVKVLNPETQKPELKQIKEKGESLVNLVILEEVDCPDGGESGSEPTESTVKPISTPEVNANKPKAKTAVKSAPESNSQPILWRIVTTLPVTNEKEAQTVIQYYRYRWLVEEFHYTLKSGCKIEELQLKDKENVLNMLMVYNLVACKILNLCYLARMAPDQKATDNAFSLEECQVLYNYHKVKNPKLIPIEQRSNPPNENKPNSIPTIATTINQVAVLGGFLSRKGDGFPGVKTIWKGLRKLAIMQEYHELIFMGKG